jgi:hypothetical protein
VLFALVAGLIASQVWKVWSQIPKFSFANCFLLVLSHVLADAAVADSYVSFYWPLIVNPNHGYMGWEDVYNSLVSRTLQNPEILIASGLLLVVYWRLGRSRFFSREPEGKSFPFKSGAFPMRPSSTRGFVGDS